MRHPVNSPDVNRADCKKVSLRGTGKPVLPAVPFSSLVLHLEFSALRSYPGNNSVSFPLQPSRMQKGLTEGREVASVSIIIKKQEARKMGSPLFDEKA